MATAALFTNPSILGRGDSADLPEKMFTADVVEGENLVASQSVRSTGTMCSREEEHSS